MENILLRSDQKEIAILTLNSPKNLNALSEAMLDALKTNLEEIQRSKKIKAVIIRAAGKAFCPGHDLREMQAKRDLENDGGRAYFEDLLSRCTHVMKLIRELPQPVIAEIQGVAAAAGCQLVATCDIAVASEEASFGVNGVNIGLFCSTPMVAVSRNISRKKIMEMLLTGEKLSANEAVQFGLINKCVPLERLHADTLNLAKLIASKPTSTVKIGKEAFYKQVEMSLDDAYNYTSEVMAINMMEIDAHEGISAFLDKRTPSWNEK